MKASIKLLRSHATVRIWFTASMQSWLGNGLAWPALVLMADARWHSAWAISLVLAADFVPSALLSATSGSLADRFDRRTLMVVGTGLSTLAFTVIFLSPNYPVLLVGALLAGIAGSIFSPASKAVIAQLTTKDDVPVLSAMRSMCSSVGFTLGPALAGALLLVVSPRWLTAADALTFLVEFILLTRLPSLRPVAVDQEVNSKLGGLRAGYRIVRPYRVAFTIICAAAFGEVFAALLNVALVPFAKHLLHHGNSSVGLLAAVTGLGLISMSSVMARKWSLSSLRWIYIGSWLVYGFSLPLMAAVPYLGVALAMKYLQGMGNAGTLSSENALINGTVPEHHAGRVFGTLDSVNSIAFAISFIASGSLLSGLGVVTSLTIAGGGCVLAGLVSWMGMGARHLAMHGSAQPDLATALAVEAEAPLV